MKKKISFGKTAILRTIGIIICLFALIVLFSGESFLAPLTHLFLNIFGFVGFWILVPVLFIFGFYLVLRQQLMKFRFDITLWGLLLLVVSFLILGSSWGSEGMSVNILDKQYIVSMFTKGENYVYLSFSSPSCLDIYESLSKDSVNIANVHLGGGYLGFIFCGALNSAFTPIGTTIVSWLLVVISVLLVLNRQIKKLFNYIKGGKQRRKAREDVYSHYQENEHENKIVEFTDQNDNFSEEPEFDNNLAMRTFNSNQSFTEPVFSFSEEEDNSSQFISPSPSKPISQNPVSSNNANTNQVVTNDNVLKDTYIEHKDIDNSFEEPKLFDNNDTLDDDIEEESDSNYESSKEVIETINSNNYDEIDDDDIEDEPDYEVEEPKVVEVKPQPTVVAPKEHSPLAKKAVIKPHIKLPPVDLLDVIEATDDDKENEEANQDRIRRIEKTFSDMGVAAHVTGQTVGPCFTRFAIQTDPGVSITKVTNLVKDLRIRLQGLPLRLEEVVYGKDYSGLELPNSVRKTVGLRETIEYFNENNLKQYEIPFGKDINGDIVHGVINSFPHMLVAGGTGSGKSIFMHSIILTLIMRNDPSDLRLMLIDPKSVEMNFYEDIPHLMCPIISDHHEAKNAFDKLVNLMNERYALLKEYKVQNIEQFNKIAVEKGLEKIPLIVAFIDEYADINENCKEIRSPIATLAGKARAAGISLVIATQRPSVNVLDGVIKGNIPTRVALKVSSGVDSNVILDEYGAEDLLGNGDMIVKSEKLKGNTKPRVQGCFVSNEEIVRVTDYLRAQAKPEYFPEFLCLKDKTDEIITKDDLSAPIDRDAQKEAGDLKLLELIKKDVVHQEFYSVSKIQRQYSVGFNRAGKLFDMLVNDGYVERDGTSRGCKVLIHESKESSEVTSGDASKLYVDEEDND